MTTTCSDEAYHQSKDNYLRHFILALGAVTLTAFGALATGPPKAVGQEIVHQIPMLNGLKPIWETNLDLNPGIDGPETTARYYKTADGKMHATLHVKGQKTGKEIHIGYLLEIDQRTGVLRGMLLDVDGRKNYKFLKPLESTEESGWIASHWRDG